MQRTAIIQTLAVAALFAVCAVLRAQSGDVVVIRIAQPTTDSGFPLAGANASAVGTPSAPDAWGGPRSGNEPTLSDRVVHYDIDAVLDPVKHTVTGREKLTWRNRSTQPVRTVYLHLYLNAFESADSTFFSEQRASRQHGGKLPADGEWGRIELRGAKQAGNAISWAFVHPDGGPAADHTVVRFDLPTAIAPDASATFDIDFVSQLPRVVARTGYFGSFHLVAQWFPKIAVLELPGERGATSPRWNAHEMHLNSEFYADFGSYDVRITAPRDYIVGATGEAQGAPVEQNGMLTHRYVQGDVHDFAWTADKASAPPLEERWTGPGSPEVQLKVIYPPEYKAAAVPAMKAAKDALSYFSRTLGPYPYKTLTVVIPPHNAEQAGGMEYPTFFTIEGYRNPVPDTIDGMLLDAVTIHEFGHSYFYGILASNEFEEPMLDEGLNEYWDARMLRERGQAIHLTTPFLKALGLDPRFKVFDLERVAARRDDPADAPGQNAWARLQGIGPAYGGTATVMRDLEERLGKEATERAFKEYYQRWKFRHPSVADLRETLAFATGQRAVVEAAFAQQIYQANRVDDRVVKITSVEQTPQPGFGVTEKALRQQIDAARTQWKKDHPAAQEGEGPYPYLSTVTVRRFGAAVPQTLVVTFADGSKETARWDGSEKWQTLRWTKHAKVVSAELDPRHLHYLDANKLDDSRTLTSDGSAKRRWTGDFAAFVQLLFSLIATV